MFFNDNLGVFRLDLNIESIVRHYLDDRALFAETETAGKDYLYLIGESFSLEFVSQIPDDCIALGGMAARAPANENMHVVF